MMTSHNGAYRSGLIPVVVGASLLLGSPARGQAPPASPGEVKAVFRISKQFIADVAAREEVVASIPYDDRILGFRCRGVIDGRGRVSVDLITSPGEASFVVSSSGTAQTTVQGVRGPFAATGLAWGPFATQTLVRFDGRKFYRVETAPLAQVHGRLDHVEGRRGGPVGRVVGRLALPIGRRMVPRAEAEATPIGLRYLSNFADGMAEEIVAKLDRTTPVEKSMNRLFPETRDWVFQMSADPYFMQAAYGPRGGPVPALPQPSAHFKDTRLEMWLHTTTTEAKDLAKLSKKPLAKPLVHAYLKSSLPELAALTENWSVDSVGPWLVVSVGAPEAK
jgi:hypothetical protein